MDEGFLQFRFVAGMLYTLGLIAVGLGLNRDHVLLIVVLLQIAMFLEYRFNLVSDTISRYDPKARQRQMIVEEARTRSIGHQGAMMRVREARANEENHES